MATKIQPGRARFRVGGVSVPLWLPTRADRIAQDIARQKNAEFLAKQSPPQEQPMANDTPARPDVSMGRVLINNISYRGEVIKVAEVTVDGSTCTVPFSELPSLIEEGGPYAVQIKTMSLRAFEALPEFTGW